ncbi:MAG: mannose-1-phosphate guanylyltransferase/mannose-6-phosphate isomerase, partial [Rhodospirillales bacterium]|nr:mannose-1-phosphate guanylyltransferase/mannose-6-phosphate isomerase [Rhodospirillales bacterium]
MTKRSRIQPVVLCGGSGSRLWPVSRETFPKQFIRLTSERTLYQETLARLADVEDLAPPIIVSNEEFGFLVEDQAAEIGVKPTAIILEPHRRNTAPAIALAAIEAAAVDPATVLLVVPSDHALHGSEEFAAAIRSARHAAECGFLVTFGVEPTSPETGYGYIRCEESPIAGGFRHVDRFIEKPERETAERFLAEGDYYWNSGIFAFSADAILGELDSFEPELLHACRVALATGSHDGAVIKPFGPAFAEAPDISIDYAVMERTGAAAVVPARFGWSDVGSWSAVAELGSGDSERNLVQGNAVLTDCQGTFVRGNGRLVAAIGLTDQVVIDTEDALLIAPRGRVQEVKAVVERLKADKVAQATEHKQVHRPWGTYKGIHLGAQHQVKHIVVKPGGKLSYQYHHHRAEHWVVVAGVAEVTVGEETKTLHANETVFIPLGAPHRLHNPGNEPMHLIEVQFGDYLGEDDIVRLE